MLNQLLAFSDDPDFVTGAELVYVIDDHRLVSPLAAEAPMFEASFGVPFRTVWSGENRGFAGRDESGVANSRASFVLLMNSDVIPVAPGWLERMRSVLAAHPEIGILGARLHYPNGAVQHDGMGFHWEPTWQAYLNKHPGAGLPGSNSREKFIRRQAVTAACAMLRREVYDAVGGLDEKFLIGDFEDFDLCLKVREKGLEIACLPLPATLIHLERQSFNAIGTPSFRDYVVALQRLETSGAMGGGDRENLLRRQAADEYQMKAMVIAHAHPDFSVGGAEIAAYNLFRTLKGRAGYAEFDLSRPNRLASQPHGSIMLRRLGEYLWRQDIGDWFRLRTQNPMAVMGVFREFLRTERPDVVFLHHYAQHRRGGVARDQADAAGLPADRDVA